MDSSRRREKPFFSAKGGSLFKFPNGASQQRWAKVSFRQQISASFTPHPPFSFFSLFWTSACEVRAAWKEKPHNIIRNAVRIKNTGCCHTHRITAGGHVGWVRQQEKYSITYHGLQMCLESKGIFPLLSSCPSWPLSVFLWSPSLPCAFHTLPGSQPPPSIPCQTNSSISDQLLSSLTQQGSFALDVQSIRAPTGHQ